jgi:hypothetical protein
LPLGVCSILGLNFCPPLSDQLVSEAYAGRKVGKHASRPLGGSAALPGS